jgi:uncharacterized membrane protein YraQ (UPF0718 family)
MIAQALSLLADVGAKVALTFAHNWPYLLAGIVGAGALKTYAGTDRVAAWLRRRRALAVAGSVGVAAGTPLCSCGTTAVVLSMLASTVPWAPVVVFMVASPLTSPSELLYSAGLFGWPFALAFFGGSIALGLAAGAVTALAERLGWLRNQARLATADGCAATLGIPFYLNSDGSLPFVASLIHAGMGAGPAMAFLVTGAGTSLGAISGGLLIARWRILAIVVATLWAGAILLGLATSTIAL